MMNNKLFAQTLLVASAMALTTSTYSSGFQLTEMSAKKLGQANAGAAAYGDDATTVFWNAAGLAKLDQSQAVVNGSIIDVNVEFNKAFAVDAFGNPLSGNNGGELASPAFVPASFYAQVRENFTWGIGIHAPFGLTTEYDRDSIFRFQAVKSEVKGIDINPAIAISNKNIHIGAGLDIQYFDVSLTSVVDYGAVCVGSVGIQAAGTFCVPPGLVGLTSNGPVLQVSEGFTEISGDSLAFGWNLGIMVDLTDNFTWGASYRSSIKHDLEGKALFENAPDLFTQQGLFLPSNIEAQFDSPSLFMLSAKWDVNPYWTLAADISQSTWSNFVELDVEYLDSNQPNTVEPFDWKDVNRYSLGAEYKHNDKWTFRTGVAYDDSPITEAERGPRLPSNSRTWLSFGASYEWSPSTSIDLAFVHLFIDDPIQFTRTGSLGDTISGEYVGDTNILSFQYTKTF